jgi:hypothetical protein
VSQEFFFRKLLCARLNVDVKKSTMADFGIL